MTGQLTIRDVSDVSEWDDLVWSNPHGTIFSASGWGEYKTRRGWSVRRLLVEADNHLPVLLLQAQIRRKGPFRIVFVQGGPLVAPGREKMADSALALCLQGLGLGPRDLVVVNFERAEGQAALLALLSAGFAPGTRAGRHTLDVDLSRGVAAVRDGMENRARRGLAGALKSPTLTARFLDDPAERLAAFDRFAAMYEALKARKGFANAFAPAQYRDLVARDPHHWILEVRDGDEVVLVRIAHVGAGRCTDFFAASSEKARGGGAASLSVWRMVERAAAEGLRVFDHGGIDPAANPGVFVFKRGLTRAVAATGAVWFHHRSPRVARLAAALFTAR